jgi:hypothetical protein
MKTLLAAMSWANYDLSNFKRDAERENFALVEAVISTQIDYRVNECQLFDQARLLNRSTIFYYHHYIWFRFSVVNGSESWTYVP